jgi:dTDP-glucose 4,6-dehydratase
VIKPDIIIHMAADTHVDYSIKNPVEVIRNNVISTVNLLEYARTIDLKLFQYFSTDEVYGPAINSAFNENDRHNPGNPYSASKSASEMICLAYQNTYKIPLIITNLMNAIGPMQYPEKFLPLVVNKVMKDEVVKIHCGKNLEIGSRFYIHVKNIAKAVIFIIDNVEVGSKINICGECEVNNLEMAQKIAKIMGKELKYELCSDIEERPGLDIRYALDSSKLIEMGFVYDDNFDDLLNETVKWYLSNLQYLNC